MNEMAEALRELQSHIRRINALEESVSTLCATTDYLLNELRPDTAPTTENPNQKDDLEIFNRIVPSEDFLRLEGNMFIN